MTPQEFKAWFEGFTEAFEGSPTKVQWARIKKRVEEIDGKPTTERIFVDRYWPTHPLYYYNTPPLTRYQAAVGTSTTSNTVCYNNTVYDTTSAMYSLGVVDAQAIAAGV